MWGKVATQAGSQTAITNRKEETKRGIRESLRMYGEEGKVLCVKAAV